MIIDGIRYGIKNNEAAVTEQSKTITTANILSTITYKEKTYSVTSIGDQAFYWCNSLTSVTIPDSVTSINSYTFWNCNSLTSITIPNSVTSIGEKAFSNCTSLTSITIPDSVTSIGYSAFSNCTSLTSITLPDNVTYIGKWAFSICSNLTSVYYKGTASDWSNISIDLYNSQLTDARRYYYSKTKPTASGNYWHYVDGAPTKW